jgi:DNA-binding NarL/FixJ family response regulator
MLDNPKKVHVLCPQCGFRVKSMMHPSAVCDRYRKILELRTAGLNNAEVGRTLSLSRERVRQILLRAGPEVDMAIPAKSAAA